VATQRNWQIGDKIKGRYEISKIFGGPGKSGMGIVYICYDHELQEPVAIKTFQDRYFQNKAFIERFRNEAETWFRLRRHPNIVELKKLERIDDRLFIFLEYVIGDDRYGVDLDGWIMRSGLTKNGKHDIGLISNFAIQFCHGMMHAQGIYKSIKESFVHRDIKPQNILITKDRIVKVTDFGLVKSFYNQEINQDELDRKSGNQQLFVSYGGICGTPPYMSPEQCRGEQVDTRSDIYSFGCVLYEMLTGKKVYLAGTPREFIYHHLKTKPLSPNSQSELDTIVMKCLEKEKQYRYEDFGTLEKDLAKFYYGISHETIPAPKGSDFNIDMGGSLFTIGESLLALGNYSFKITGTQGKMDPNSAEYHYQLGISLTNQGKLDEAITEYGKALKMNPKLTGAQSKLAEIYSKQGKRDAAVEEYKKITELAPKYSVGHYQLANEYRLCRRFDLAAEEYKEALNLDSKSSYAHLGLGNVYLEQSKFDVAIEEYLAALKIDPKISEAYYGLGLAYSKKAEYDTAINEYNKALSLKPGFLLAQYELGVAYHRQGNFEEALKCFEDFIRVAPPGYAFYVAVARENISDIKRKQ
jgi:eukaryotic-like serine/threonine-protein kinase